MTQMTLTLPYSVGDVIYPAIAYKRYYTFKNYIEGIYPYQITNIGISINKKGEVKTTFTAYALLDGEIIDTHCRFKVEDIGKKVFLHKEDAMANPEVV